MGISVSGISDNEIWQYHDLGKNMSAAYEKMKQEIQSILDLCDASTNGYLACINNIKADFKYAYKSESGTVKQEVSGSIDTIKGNMESMIQTLRSVQASLDERIAFYRGLCASIRDATSRVVNEYDTSYHNIFDSGETEREKKAATTYNIEGNNVTINWG